METVWNEIKLQYITLLITIGVYMCLGAFWYSPRVFGKAWAHAQGFELGSLRASPLHYFGALMVAIVVVLGIASLLFFFKISTLSQGLILIAVGWLTFIATSHFAGVIWARKPLKVYFIDVSYLLFAMMVSVTLLMISKHT